MRRDRPRPTIALGLLLSACTSAGLDDAPNTAPQTVAQPATAAIAPRPTGGTMPAPEPVPPGPTTPPPAGTPAAEGSIAQILAVDHDRAVVVFTPYTDAGTPTPTLALMRRSGAVDWAVALDHAPLRGRTTSGIEIVGDAVSVALAHPGDLHDRLERIQIHDLADGRRRAVIEPGAEYYGRETVVVGDERYDSLVQTRGAPSLLIASDAHGERWRAALPEVPGVEIVALPTAVAVHQDDGERGTWRVLSRRTGKAVATVPGSRGCSDGQRWFVLDRDRVVEVDAGDFSTRAAIGALGLPGSTEPIYLRDCTIIDGRPIAFAQRGMIEGLFAVGADGAVTHAMSLGVRRYRDGAVDPLPDRLHPVVALVSLDPTPSYDLAIAELGAADTTLTGAPRTWGGVQGLVRFDHGAGGGYVVATRELIAVVDGRSGEVLGRHVRRDSMALQPSALVGTTLWLPPAVPTRLGRDAPTVLDLSQPHADPAVRAAATVALGPELGGRPTFGCDSMDRVHYDGVETAQGLGPVPISRLPPWNADQIAAAARGFACAPADATVLPLAWLVIEDHRPLRNHYVLALVEHTFDGAPMYTAVAMYRHATNTQWGISTSFHDPSQPLRRYTARPTTADLDAFVDQAGFGFVDDWGQVLRANVIDSNWIAATGERPTRHFAAGIEQPD